MNAYLIYRLDKIMDAKPSWLCEAPTSVIGQHSERPTAAGARPLAKESKYMLWASPPHKDVPDLTGIKERIPKEVFNGSEARREDSPMRGSKASTCLLPPTKV
jgi:hypothetical protein